MLFAPRKQVNLPPREAETLLLTYISPVLPEVLKGFYEWITETPELNSILAGTLNGRSLEQAVAHLTKAQTTHWTKRLQDGDGPDYRKRIEIIGDTHMRIKLPLNFFIEGYRYVLTECTQRIHKTLIEKQPQFYITVVRALEQLVLDDLRNIADAYHSATSQRADTQLGEVTDVLNSRVGTAISTIATATQELSSTAHSISGQLESSGVRIDKAAGQSAEAQKMAEELSNMAGKIQEIVNMISGISDQINLLALNATIEAARAGDAGRGFAVVADEVKKLAGNTNKATEDVRLQIDRIRAGAETVRASINGLAETVVGMQEITHSISGTMREQTIATGDISKHATELTDGVAAFLDELEKIRHQG